MSLIHFLFKNSQEGVGNIHPATKFLLSKESPQNYRGEVNELRKRESLLLNHLNEGIAVLDEYFKNSSNLAQMRTKLEDSKKKIKLGYVIIQGNKNKKTKNKKKLRYAANENKRDLSDDEIAKLKSDVIQLKNSIKSLKEKINPVYTVYRIIPYLQNDFKAHINDMIRELSNRNILYLYNTILEDYKGLKESVNRTHINEVKRKLYLEELKKPRKKDEEIVIVVPESEKNYFDEVYNSAFQRYIDEQEKSLKFKSTSEVSTYFDEDGNLVCV